MIKRYGTLAMLMGLVALAMLGTAAYHILSAPDLIECAMPAPFEVEAPQTGQSDDGDLESPKAEDGAQPGTSATPRKPGKLKDMMAQFAEEDADVSALVPGYALWGCATGVSVAETENGKSASASLWAVGERYFELYPVVLRQGRAPAGEELKYGGRVALIDEQVALTLFGTTDVVDRTVTVWGHTWRVVGVARHQRTVGDPAADGIYVPIASLAADGTQLQTVAMSAPVRPGTGRLQAISELAQRMLPGSTVHDSRRAKTLALLVPRWAMCALAAYALSVLMSMLFGVGGRWFAEAGRDLRRDYLLRMMPRLLLRGAGWFVGFGALCALLVLLAGQMMHPVLVFPEWVPLVPVEPAEITKTFWSLQWKNNQIIRTVTPLGARMNFFGSLANTGTVALLLALVVGLLHRARRVEQ